MNIGLVFGIIVAIMVIGLIIIFGYQQRVELQRIQELAQLRKTLVNLETVVDRVHSLGGETAERFTCTFPPSVKKV